MNEQKRQKAIESLATFLHLVESQIEAHESGRIVVFGQGRLSTRSFAPEHMEITVEDIKNEPKKGQNENDE